MLRIRLPAFISTIPISAIATLLISLFLTTALFFNINALERQNVRAEFERHAGNRINAVRDGLDEAVEQVLSINRLFATIPSVKRERFHEFARPVLAHNPHIRSITFQRLVSNTERAAFEAERRDLQPGFERSRMMPRSTARPSAAGRGIRKRGDHG